VSRFRLLRLPRLPVVAEAELDKPEAAAAALVVAVELAVVAELEGVPQRRRLLLPLPFNSSICD
jgi:hypothetical protein